MTLCFFQLPVPNYIQPASKPCRVSVFPIVILCSLFLLHDNEQTGMCHSCAVINSRLEPALLEQSQTGEAS